MAQDRRRLTPQQRLALVVECALQREAQRASRRADRLRQEAAWEDDIGRAAQEQAASVREALGAAVASAIEQASEQPRYNTPVCDVCKSDCDGTYVDGKTVMGPWAIMCEVCFPTCGTGIGVGRGQRYDSATRRKLEG